MVKIIENIIFEIKIRIMKYRAKIDPSYRKGLRDNFERAMVKARQELADKGLLKQEWSVEKSDWIITPLKGYNFDEITEMCINLAKKKYLMKEIEKATKN